MTPEKMHDILSAGFAAAKEPLTERQDIMLRGMVLGLHMPPPKVWVASIDSDAENTVKLYLKRESAVRDLMISVRNFSGNPQFWLDALKALESPGGEYSFCGSFWSVYEQDIQP